MKQKFLMSLFFRDTELTSGKLQLLIETVDQYRNFRALEMVKRLRDMIKAIHALNTSLNICVDGDTIHGSRRDIVEQYGLSFGREAVVDAQISDSIILSNVITYTDLIKRLDALKVKAYNESFFNRIEGGELPFELVVNELIKFVSSLDYNTKPFAVSYDSTKDGVVFCFKCVDANCAMRLAVKFPPERKR